MTGVAVVVAALLVAWWATATWRPPGVGRKALTSPVVFNLDEVARGAVGELEAEFGWEFVAAGDAVSRRADGTAHLDTLERGTLEEALPFVWAGREAVSDDGELVVVAGAACDGMGEVGMTYGVRPSGVPSGLTVSCDGEVWHEGSLLCPALGVGGGDGVLTGADVFAMACEEAAGAVAVLAEWGNGRHAVAVVGGELRVRVSVVVTGSTGTEQPPDWGGAVALAREVTRARWDERLSRKGELVRRMLRALPPAGERVRELVCWMRAEGGEVAEIANVELVQMARGGASAEGFVLALELVPEAALKVFRGEGGPLRALDAWYERGGRARGDGFREWVCSLDVSEYDAPEFGVVLKTALWVTAYTRDETRAGLPGMLNGLLLRAGVVERGVLLGAIAGGPPLVLKEVLRVPVRTWFAPRGGFDVLEVAVRRVEELVSVGGVGAEVDHFLATVLGSTWKVPEASRVVERVITLMSVAGRRESVEVLEQLSREGGLGGASRLARWALKTLRTKSHSGALTVSVGEGGELTVSEEAGGLTPADE